MGEIIIKKTGELTVDEISEICDLFEEVFIGHSASKDEYAAKHSSTPLGYTIHALLKNEQGNVIGSHNLTPFYYIFNGEKTIFAYGGGTMIKKEYRNFLMYKRLIEECYRYANDDGISFLMGFPNDISYPIQKKGLKREDIGELTTYILPRNIGAIKPRLRFLNFFSAAFFNIMISFSKLSSSKKIYKPLIHKDQETFSRSRYNKIGMGENVYRYIETADYKAVYRIMNYKGVNTAFLLDVYPLSAYNFDNAIRFMCKKGKKSRIDAVMYVGHLPFKPMSLIKLPSRYEPKKFHFVGTILNHELIDERIFDISNWEVSLTNYDLV